MCVALGRSGLSYGSASDGLDALDQLEGSDYSLVLLDLMMPRLDGIGFLREFRKSQEKNPSRPLILMMTACPEREDLLERTELLDMVQAIVPKPFDVGLLVEKIRRYIPRYDTTSTSSA